MKEQDRNLEYFDDLDKLESLKQEYNTFPFQKPQKHVSCQVSRKEKP